MPVHYANGKDPDPEAATPKEGAAPAADAPPQSAAPGGGAPMQRMGGMPEGSTGPDERQLDALVEGVQELIFGGGTEDGEISAEMAQLLQANADAPHGAPEIAADTAGQIMNAAVRGAEAQGVLLEPDVVMYGTMVATDKTIEVMEGETGMALSDDEVVQAFMKAMEVTYSMLEDTGLFNQRDAESVLQEIAADPTRFDAAVRDLVGPETADAVAQAVGQGGMTAVPEQDLPPAPETAAPGGPPPEEGMA